jgi:hypothetical protein
VETFNVVRFYRDANIRRRTILFDLTLAEAQAHCSDPETSSSTAKGPKARRITRKNGPWFDGYEEVKERS